jgi:peptide/nickel transport system permease protein
MTMRPDASAPTGIMGEELAEESGLATGKVIEGRSLSQIAWGRLKRDRVAIGGGVIVIILVLIALFAPLIISWYGHPIDKFNNDALDPNLGGLPNGGFSGANGEHWLGVEPITGRDIFSRVVYGARVSLFVAVTAAVVATIIGVVLGIVSGFFGGWIDSIISRTMDLLLAFPQLLFAIALVSVIPADLFHIGGSWSRMFILVGVISIFGWPYIGRIVRGQVLSMREREFVEASRSLGARGPRILFRELLPNLLAPILVYATLIIPQNILTEAALSFLGVGVIPPTPSWGSMLSDAIQWYTIDPMFMVVPGVAIFLTVLSFNLFGDGLRDAFDPKTR